MGCCDSPLFPTGDPDIKAASQVGAMEVVSFPRPSSTRYVPAAIRAPLRTNTARRHSIEDAWNLPEPGFTSDHAQVKAVNQFLGH
jgi:hypothetical protein